MHLQQTKSPVAWWVSRRPEASGCKNTLSHRVCLCVSPAVCRWSSSVSAGGSYDRWGCLSAAKAPPRFLASRQKKTPSSPSASPPCLLSLTCRAHLRTLSPRAVIRAGCRYATQRADDEATAVDYRLNSKEAEKQLIKVKQLTRGWKKPLYRDFRMSI